MLGIITMPHYFNIILGLFDQVHKMLDHYVFQGYHQLAVVLRYPLALCITLYIVLLGYSMSHGWISVSINHMVKVAIKLGVIYTFAMNWDFFSHTAVDFIQGGSNQLGGLILQANQKGLDISTGVEGALQTVLIHFTKIGYWCWRRGTWHSVSPYFEAMMIWGAGIALVIYSTIQLLIADIMIAILLSMAPLFIAMTVFEQTRALFDRWLGYLVSFALLTLFVAVMLSFVVNISEWVTSGMNENNIMSSMFITSFVPIVLVCCISMALIKRVTTMAYEIGAGFSSMASSSGWGGQLSQKLQVSLPKLAEKNNSVDQHHQPQPQSHSQPQSHPSTDPKMKSYVPTGGQHDT
jgi:type IV secretion system protein VirB6